ncbi:hypothetical protein TCAL_05120 [Tigriopus californicus]|uniref:Uncharacterized protein n=1 Tax=Tigriopus californicus TaxID=6832 RepID=A0A553PPA5_TIGCA|nr:hypothetical protein TCAL_05120 [Tigriopus californicus]
MVSCQKNETESGTGEMSEDALNMKYVVQNVLTNTDRFLEDHLSGSFRVWHVILIISVTFMIAIRIPRTKTEIEANAKRRALLKDFRLKLKELKAADLDEMDYRRALDKLREEFKADNESLAQSEAISILSLCDDLPEDDLRQRRGYSEKVQNGSREQLV